MLFFSRTHKRTAHKYIKKKKKGWRASKKLQLIRACNRPSYKELATLLLETKLTTRPGTHDHAPKGLQMLERGEKKLLEHQQKTTAAAPH